MDFKTFIHNQGVITSSIGIIIGFMVNNLFDSFRKVAILPFMIKYLNIKESVGEFGSILIEFIFILVLVYLFYRYIVMPIFKEQMEKEQEQKCNWREHLIKTHHEGAF